MKKKIIGILIVTLFITTITLPAIGNTILINNTEISKNNRNDEVDQNQTHQDWFIPVGVWPYPEPYPPNLNYMVAQGFKPTKDVLTRVELLIGKNRTTTYDYVVAIRDDLSGPDLTTTSVSADQIITEDYDWTEFDFDDILVTHGKTYYIVSYTTDTKDNWYAWGLDDDNVYPNGIIYSSTNDGQTWEEKNSADACFKTYGRDNNRPNLPDITGEINGKIQTYYEYTVSSIDPDGDNIAYYLIVWGDDTHTNKTGPFASGESVIASHKWTKQGTYKILIRATDIFGKHSPWGTLDVTMPRNRATYNSLFYRFLEQFPILQKILLFQR